MHALFFELFDFQNHLGPKYVVRIIDAPLY